MKIIGTGRMHPAKVVTNAMLEEFLDTSDEWIKERTGISERRLVTSEKLEDMAAAAAREAIADAGLTAADIDYIICSNVVNEYITPALSCIVQGAIGAKCACVDVKPSLRIGVTIGTLPTALWFGVSPCRPIRPMWFPS